MTTIVDTVIAELARERGSATYENIRCVNTDLQAALAYLQSGNATALPVATTAQLYGGSGVAGQANVVSLGANLGITSETLSATNTGSLPAATTAQLYGGTGAAGTAAVVTVGTGLALSGETLTATAAPSPVQEISVSLSSAQILALSVTPVQVVPAPGAGFKIQILQFVCELVFGTIAYTGGQAGLFVGPATTYQAGGLFTNCLQAAASSTEEGPASGTLVPNSASNNVGVYVTGATALVAGNGTCNLTILYYIVPVH